VCVYSITHPACTAHRLYCHPLLVQLYNIFPHYLITNMILGRRRREKENKEEKKLIEDMCALIFSTTFV
jgi:hypothetical protein